MLSSQHGVHTKRGRASSVEPLAWQASRPLVTSSLWMISRNRPTWQPQCRLQQCGTTQARQRRSCHGRSWLIKNDRGRVVTCAQTQTFPASYEQAVRQAQESCKAALADGKQLLEVEFPTAGLASVSGDADGASEMNCSMDYMRQFLGAWRDQASGIRVFFADKEELGVAQKGQNKDSTTGRSAVGASFPDSGPAFKFGVLTQQSFLWALIGVDLTGFSPVSEVGPDDKMMVIAYPCYNPREELSAVARLVKEVATPRSIPLIVFNGELDRVREGYYVSWAFRELATIASDLLPLFETSYYIHNFKGSTPGVLFRAYPGPWQVLTRNPKAMDQLVLVYSSETRPTLKAVAMDILPNASRRL